MGHERRLSVFVPHASPLLTDHEPHGDGLIAFEVLRRLAERGYRLEVAAQDVQIRQPLPSGLTIHPIMHGGELNPIDRVRYAIRVRRLYDRLAGESPFDLIHQLNPGDVGVGTFLPHDVVPMIIGPYPARWPASAGRPAAAARKLVRAALQWQQQRRTALLIAFTRGGLANVRVRRPGLRKRQPPKVVLIPPGLDLDHFAPAAGLETSTARHPPSVLYLASLETRKGILTLLEAFDQVAAAVPGAELRIAGKGSLAEEVADRIAASPHRARIRSLGVVERDAVPVVMGDATVYCLPSYGEPFGMSALEAMACGRPVVVTAAGGPAELVPDGGGRKVPPGDARALAEALTELLTAPAEVLEAMGRVNRRRAETYSWEAAVDRLEQAYVAAVERQVTGS